MRELIDLQITIFGIIFIGLFLRKKGMIGPQGQKNITDLVINLILPCNIIRSFMIDMSENMAAGFMVILLISCGLQAASVLLGKLLYRTSDPARRKCLRYGIICSNAGFMGNPIAQGVFGAEGLMLASVFLLPQRIMMWSEGVAIFTDAPGKKELFMKIVKHPCIIACELGMVILLTGLKLPSGLTSVITTLSNCNTALSMLVIGMILAQADPRTLFDREIISYSLLRLVLIPLCLFAILKIMQIDALVLGTSVLLCAMPAGATTTILAATYDGDAEFAVKLVVMSTFISLFTTPIWSIILV